MLWYRDNLFHQQMLHRALWKNVGRGGEDTLGGVETEKIKMTFSREFLHDAVII
jgi:hypothetical protein